MEDEHALLRATGFEVEPIAGGCCGLAGSFGFEAGHYEVSMGCGEQGCLPASGRRRRRSSSWPTDSHRDRRLQRLRARVLRLGVEGVRGHPLEEQAEVLALTGDVCDGQVHAHVVVGLRDTTARGGHLLRGHVRPTLELILDVAPAHLRKSHDPEIGLALIDLDA